MLTWAVDQWSRFGSLTPKSIGWKTLVFRDRLIGFSNEEQFMDAVASGYGWDRTLHPHSEVLSQSPTTIFQPRSPTLRWVDYAQEPVKYPIPDAVSFSHLVAYLMLTLGYSVSHISCF